MQVLKHLQRSLHNASKEAACRRCNLRNGQESQDQIVGFYIPAQQRLHVRATNNLKGLRVCPTRLSDSCCRSTPGFSFCKLHPCLSVEQRSHQESRTDYLVKEALLIGLLRSALMRSALSMQSNLEWALLSHRTLSSGHIHSYKIGWIGFILIFC